MRPTIEWYLQPCANSGYRVWFDGRHYWDYECHCGAWDCEGCTVECDAEIIYRGTEETSAREIMRDWNIDVERA